MSAGDLLDRCNHLFNLVDGRLLRKVTLKHNAKVGSEAGWVDGDYRKLRVDTKTYLTHRIIYLMTHQKLPEFVDHVDGNTLNNLPENLRAVTKEQNRWNCKGNAGSLSGVKGVYKDGKKWKAMITRGGCRYYLGMHNSISEAAKVVRDKDKQLSGEYHREQEIKV